MIKFENVWVDVNHTEILRDINIEIPQNKVTGFFGVNGSGKTMIMRAFLGFVRPKRGRIIIGTKQLWKDIDFPESVGFLIENPAFINTLSGMKNLEAIASIRGNLSKQDISIAMERIGLDPCSKKKYRHYSLGMKQKLGIASAIMERPDLIVLDEPTNALDEVSYDRLKDIIHEEQIRGATIVLACHDRDLLYELSDTVFKLEEGQITRKESLR